MISERLDAIQKQLDDIKALMVENAQFKTGEWKKVTCTCRIFGMSDTTATCPVHPPKGYVRYD